MEDTNDQDELLNLTLALVSDSGSLRKRKRIDHVIINTNKNITLHQFLNNNNETCEGKIFELLEKREQMLRLDGRERKGVVEEGKGLHLIHLLLITATAVDENNVTAASDNLSELYQGVSLAGDSVQRVVAYFADGLAARLLTRKSPFYDMLMKPPTPEEEFLAFTDLYRVSPYYQFAHFTANQVIIEAFEAEQESNNRALHVVDFDISYGFQWPSLIQSLSEKATAANRISLRITGLSRFPDELQDTETRLVSFAKTLPNIVFEFQGLIRGAKLTGLRKKKNETVAVNLVFHNTEISETLMSVHSLRPSIVVLVEQERRQSPRSFICGFMEYLHYFAAMFDSLEECMPSESAERKSIEKSHLGKQIKSMLNNERMEAGKGRMEEHGFEGERLSSKCMIQGKLLLKYSGSEEGGNGFKVFEREQGRAICLGWQDRCLITASAWRCI